MSETDDKHKTQGSAANPTPWRDPEAKPFIQIRDLRKEFGDFTAVDSVSLDIYKGELFAILGASGCGKSTLLRMLAGFEDPSRGSVIIDGIDMTELPPYERPVNMMFQSYAVFPHMSVGDNVAYGLKKEGLDKAEIKSRVVEMLELVQLQDFAKRKPHQLSGGQQQRVALARALIKRPKVLLLDEPLAALDKKLRERTQFELMNIQDQLGVTFIVVTHDQEEAMTLATRIAVMDEGQFVQIGTPSEIYEYPSSRFVADFFGTINLFHGTVGSTDADAIHVACDETDTVIHASPPRDRILPDDFFVAVRPEKIRLDRKPPTEPDLTVMRGVVEDLAYYGNYSVYRIKTDSGKLVQVSQQNTQRSAELVLEWEEEVYMSWPRDCSVVLTQ
jgi:putrescine transport system ATP-binding protein